MTIILLENKKGVSTAATIIIAVIITGAVVGAGVYYGTQGGQTTDNQPKEGETTYTIGLAAHSVRNAWEDLWVKCFLWYCSDISEMNDNIEIKTTWTEAGYNATLQITQIKRLIDQGVDGIVTSPWDVQSLGSAMDYAKQNDVPVICTNTVVNHDYPLMFVGIGNERATNQLGVRIREYLRDNVEPIGKVEGTVLSLGSEPGDVAGEARLQGIRNALADYENVTIEEVYTNNDRGQSKTKTLNKLRGGLEPDAIFGHNTPIVMGGVDGLIEHYGDEGAKDKYVTNMGPSPTTLKAIDNGYVDVAVGQVPKFYNPIAVHYMLGYLENGESALPDYGEKITTDDLKIQTGKKHLGIEPWKVQSWAPATIENVSEFSPSITKNHRWFQCSGIIVTENNVDSPLVWGNYPLPGW